MFSLFQAYGQDQFHTISAWIYVGCSKEDVKLLAWSHSVDNEYQKTMTTIDHIQTIHQKCFREFPEERTPERIMTFKTMMPPIVKERQGSNEGSEDQQDLKSHKEKGPISFRKFVWEAIQARDRRNDLSLSSSGGDFKLFRLKNKKNIKWLAFR
ncbi:hypothetical protein R1flu_018156 [Riccia fluitans]|uniref:Uncharacterized protein n=1 Tax=Riccia fluitans TaxID=41844 RepID=A0ABD1ZF81_9MARC